MTIYSIYRIVNTVTNLFYIGFTSQRPSRRWNSHKSESRMNKPYVSYLHRAMNKYGVDSFTFEVIYQSEDREHTLNVMEPFFINEYDSVKNGYNLTPGGEGTFGRTFTEEQREHLRNILTGRKHTEESKAKISAAQTGRKMGPMSYERRLAISAGQVGRKHTSETKAKMSVVRKGKPVPQESRDKMAAARSLNWIVVHPSGEEERVTNMRQFCITNGLSAAAMTYVAQGKRMMHKGYRCRKE